MIYLQDNMHPEDWNPSLKKSRHKKSEVNKTAKHKNNSTAETEASSIVHSISTPSSQDLNHTGEEVSHENEQSEIIGDTHMASEQAVPVTMPLSKTDGVPFTLSKSSSFDTLLTLKGKKSRNKKWLFFLFGLLISLVSGIITFALLVNADRGEMFSSQQYHYEESEVSTDNPLSLIGKVKGLILPADDLTEKEQIFDNAYEEFNAGMMQDDKRLEDGEDFEVKYNIVAEDDNLLREDTFEDSVDMARFETQDEVTIERSEKDLVFEERQPIAKSNQKKDIVAEQTIMEREESNEIVEPLTDEKSAGISSEEGKAEKLKKLSQRLATAYHARGDGSIALAEDVQNSKRISNEAATPEPELAENGKGAFEDRAYEPDKKNPVEITNANPVSLSETSLSKEKKEPSTGFTVKIFHAREEGNTTVDDGKEMSVQGGLSNTDHLITRSDVIDETDSGIHESMNNRMGNSSQEEREPFSSGATLPGKQTDSTDTGKKMLFEQTSFNDKEPVQMEGREQAIQTQSAHNKPSDSEANLPTPQRGTSSTLKEMSVIYEEQFNDNANHWPEFDNGMASALIADGEYHIEHKAGRGSHTVLHPHDLPHDMDFMIHVFISSVQSTGENSYGFVFGAKDAGNRYSFRIRNGQLYSIEKMHDGHTAKLAEGSIDNTFIRQNVHKTLKIVKQGNMVRFYVDDHYLDEIVNVDFPGDRIGFLVEGKVKTAIDWTKTHMRFKNKEG